MVNRLCQDEGEEEVKVVLKLKLKLKTLQHAPRGTTENRLRSFLP